MTRCSRCLLFLGLFALILGTVGTAPTSAHSRSSQAKAGALVPVYDLAKEIKVQGTIEKIDGFGTSGPIGTHILIQTASGVIDAHLGFGPAASRRYLGISVGESVTVIGMMQRVGSGSVLIARILTTPSHIFVLRNEHGVPIRAVPHRSTRVGLSYAMLAGRPESLTTSDEHVVGGL